MVTAEDVLDRLRPAWARVDLGRLAENYSAVAAASPVPLMPVVKADAYGHGAVQVSRRLEALGASLLAVAYVEEGVALRAAGIRVPIVVLAGFEPAQLADAVAHELCPVVSTPRMLEAVVALAEGSQRLAVHVKVDTGMSRLGFTAAELPEAAARLAAAPGLDLAGLMTHLSSADEETPVTEEQLDRFDACVSALAARGIRPRFVHVASSASLERVRPTHTLARPGLLLYGLRPRPVSPALAVHPVMAFGAQVCLLKDVPAGTAVSYGGRWVAKRPSRIATIPVGYADGVPRTDAMRERGQVAIGGRRVPVVGTICMDLIMADVTDHPRVGEGEEAVVFGDDPTAWDVADWAGTNPWQILAGIGPRVPRVYVEGGRVVAVESRY